MKRINQLVSSVVLVCFLFNTAVSDYAFAQSVPSADKLAIPSRFDDLQGIEHKDIGDIEMWFDAALNFLNNNRYPITAENLKRVNHTYQGEKAGNTIFQLKDSVFFVDELKTLSDGTIKIMVKRKDLAHGLRTYYVEYSGEHQRIDVYPKGKSKARTAGDRNAIDGYKEINENIIDKFITDRITERNFAEIEGRAKELGWTAKYPNRIMPRSYWPRQLLDSINKDASRILSTFGLSLDEAFKGKNIVFLKVQKGVELPVINFEGREIKVSCHTSNNAVYVFLEEKAFEFIEDCVNSNKPIPVDSEKKVDYIVSKMFHEAGVAYGLYPKRLDGGVILSDLDMAGLLYTSPGLRREELLKRFPQLKNLTPVNLDTNLATRDYAAGKMLTQVAAEPDPLEVVRKQIKDLSDIIQLDPVFLNGLEDGSFKGFLNSQQIVAVDIPVTMDDGTEKIFKGWRVLDNDARGTAKGGIRWDEGVCESEVRALGKWMSLKVALVGVPFGGAKGGITCNPKQLSPETERDRLMRGYTRALAPNADEAVIGPLKDVPAPDYGTGPKDMDSMRGEYFETTQDPTAIGVVTGKPEDEGGSRGRRQATGLGIFLTTVNALDLIGDKLGLGKYIKGKTVAVQAYGNVGSYAARIFSSHGAKVVAVAEADGILYNENGIDFVALDVHMAKPDGKFSNFKGAKLINIDDFWKLRVDILVPAFKENQINANRAKIINAKLIVEGANGPTTPEADDILAKRGITVIPDILANAGGVVVSYFEWLQNLEEEKWTFAKVRERLEERMRLATQSVIETAERYNISLRKAAGVIAIIRMAHAEMARNPKLSALFNESRKPYYGYGDKFFVPETIEELNAVIKGGHFTELVKTVEDEKSEEIDGIVAKITGKLPVRERGFVLISGPVTSGKLGFAVQVTERLERQGRHAIRVNFDAMKLADIERLSRGEVVRVLDTVDGKKFTRDIALNSGDILVAEGDHTLSDDVLRLIPEHDRVEISIDTAPSMKLADNWPLMSSHLCLLRHILTMKETEGSSTIDVIRNWPAQRKAQIESISLNRPKTEIRFNSYLAHELPFIKARVEPLLEEAEKVAESRRDTASLKIIERLRKTLKDVIPVSDTSVIPDTSFALQYVGGERFYSKLINAVTESNNVESIARVADGMIRNRIAKQAEISDPIRNFVIPVWVTKVSPSEERVVVDAVKDGVKLELRNVSSESDIERQIRDFVQGIMEKYPSLRIDSYLFTEFKKGMIARDAAWETGLFIRAHDGLESNMATAQPTAVKLTTLPIIHFTYNSGYLLSPQVPANVPMVRLNSDEGLALLQGLLQKATSRSGNILYYDRGEYFDTPDDLGRLPLSLSNGKVSIGGKQFTPRPDAAFLILDEKASGRIIYCSSEAARILNKNIPAVTAVQILTQPAGEKNDFIVGKKPMGGTMEISQLIEYAKSSTTSVADLIRCLEDYNTPYPEDIVKVVREALADQRVKLVYFNAALHDAQAAANESNGPYSGVMTPEQTKEFATREITTVGTSVLDEIMKLIPSDYLEGYLTAGIIADVVKEAGYTGNIFADNNSAMIFSEKAAFGEVKDDGTIEEGLGVLLPSMIRSGVKVAVIARTAKQIALIEELNQKVPKERQIIYAANVAEIRNRVSEVRRYYYYRVAGEADAGLLGVTSIEIIVKKIINFIGKVTTIIDPKVIEDMHEAARRFAQAA